jgi:hypothetical protein
MNYKRTLEKLGGKLPQPREKMNMTVRYVCSYGCDHTTHPAGPVVERDEEFFKLTIIYPGGTDEVQGADLKATR